MWYLNRERSGLFTQNCRLSKVDIIQERVTGVSLTFSISPTPGCIMETLSTVTSLEAKPSFIIFVWPQKCSKINKAQDKMGKLVKDRIKRNFVNFDLSFTAKRLRVFVVICVKSI